MKAGFPLLVLIFLLLGAGGGAAFGGGVVYGRNTAPRTTAASAPSSGAVTQLTAGGFAGGVATPGAGGRGGLGGTAGTIDALTGNVLSVRTQQGTLTNVNLSSATRILTTVTASREDLKPGTTVTVLGQPDQGGAINASAITITTPGLSGGPGPGGAATGQGRPGGTDPTGRGGPGGRRDRSATPGAGPSATP